LKNKAITNARPYLPNHNHNASMGDFDVLVDTDGAGYIVYSYGPMSIEKLQPDFLNGADENASFPGGEWNGTVLQEPGDFVEAPSLWGPRGGKYYLTTGHCCCFCFQGSGMIVYTAEHPLGPWSKQAGQADLGCVAIGHG
jgi:beta-xylosidase